MMARSFVVPKGCGSTVLLMSVVPFMNVNGTRSWLLLQGLLRRPKVGCEPSLPRMAPTGIAESSGTEGESATTPPKVVIAGGQVEAANDVGVRARRGIRRGAR